MFYKILSHQESNGKFYFPESFFAGRVSINTEYIDIKAGGRFITAQVGKRTELKQDEVMISEDIIKFLSIPVDIKYQIRYEKNTIKIGPVIGLLMARAESKMKNGRLRNLLDYCLIYPEIQGLVIAICTESIDFENKLVKGYYYKPGASGEPGNWNEGVFPFPDSIFQRTKLTEDLRLKLKEETNNHMFNSNYFNKWEFWKIVSEFKSFCDFLPETRLLNSVKDIDYMLSQHETAYLKPLNGTLSRGLYKVTKTREGYGFQGKQGDGITKTSFGEETEEYVKNIIQDHKYLIQQGLNPLRVNGRHLDFRVIMQKDHTCQWVCTGIVAFIGALGDICSNWGATAVFEDLLSRHFNFSQQEIFKKKQQIIEACIRVCKVLDLSGENYGDLGFDVIMDETSRIWVLETNKRHYHTVALWNGDPQTYFEIKANTIKYASAQSGFNVY